MPSAAERADDLRACRALLRGGSRTFHAASYLLPRHVREPAAALYAFCRVADDAVDEDGGGYAAIGALRHRIRRAYAGRALDGPVDRAFAAVAHDFSIPRALPEALLEGFEWDVARRRYGDLDGLRAYAARVAGSVGAMMSLVMGVRDVDALGRACDLGIAMQLSNIARDVGDDARAGRLYLPLEWLREAGIDPERWLARPVFSPAFGGVVNRLLLAADVSYSRVDAGIALLPPSCRPGIRAAKTLYADIGAEVARRGYDSISQRAVVSGSRKAALLAHALLARQRVPAACVAAPPPHEVRFLVTAARTPGPARARVARIAPSAAKPDQIAWVIGLFERLERRDRSGGRIVNG